MVQDPLEVPLLLNLPTEEELFAELITNMNFTALRIKDWVIVFILPVSQMVLINDSFLLLTCLHAITTTIYQHRQLNVAY